MAHARCVASTTERYLARDEMRTGSSRLSLDSFLGLQSPIDIGSALSAVWAYRCVVSLGKRGQGDRPQFCQTGDYAITSGCLGIIKSVVGTLQQLIATITAFSGRGDADADRHCHFHAARPDNERLPCDRQTQPFGNGGRYDAVGVRHDDDKFLAAQSRDQINTSDAVHCSAGKLAQHFVSRSMAIGIVDLLEVVDVKQQNRRVYMIMVNPTDQLVEMRKEVSAVVETG
jgi:hypothetical protein